MAPRRKSMSFLTLKKCNSNNSNTLKTKENVFLHNLCDYSTKISRRQSMRALKPLKVSQKNAIAFFLCGDVCDAFVILITLLLPSKKIYLNIHSFF